MGEGGGIGQLGMDAVPVVLGDGDGEGHVDCEAEVKFKLRNERSRTRIPTLAREDWDA